MRKFARYGLYPLLIVLALCASCAGGKNTVQPPPHVEAAPESHTSKTVTPDLPPVEDLRGTQAILGRVAALLARRDFSGALDLFQRIDAEDLAKNEIQILYAGALNAAGKSAEARTVANRILSGESGNTEALMILADAAALEGKDRDRRAVLEQVIKADSKHVRALTDLGNIALKGQSLRTAANYFDQALAANGNYGEALIGRAIVYRYNKEPKQAEQLLNKAARLYPQWASPLHERGRLYKGAAFYPDALRDFDAAKALEPDNYWIVTDRGATLVEMNRKSEALEEFTRAIAMEPDVFIAYVYSAGIKDETGDIDGAERDYATLAKLKPEYYFAFEGLGIIKMRKHLWAQARDAFLEAYRQAPKEYAYALLATVSWMRAGNQNDPKQFLAQVLRAAPRDTLEYTMLRLFHDMNGDLAAAVKADSEKNPVTKARMLFYLANYYDIKGNKNLADKYFLQVQELDQPGIPEWRLNEWVLEERGIKPF